MGLAGMYRIYRCARRTLRQRAVPNVGCAARTRETHQYVGCAMRTVKIEKYTKVGCAMRTRETHQYVGCAMRTKKIPEAIHNVGCAARTGNYHNG